MKAATIRNAAKMMSAVLCVVMALASAGMTMPMASHANHCKSMAPRVTAGHDCCPRKVLIKDSCATHSATMSAACCQIADERLPAPRETGTPGSQVENHASGAANALAPNVARRNLQSGWLNGGLRYSRPVFEAKADLLI